MIEVTARMICDGCGTWVLGDIQRETCSGFRSYWSLKDRAKRGGWVTLQRYGKPRHYCNECADKPMPAKQPEAKPTGRRGE